MNTDINWQLVLAIIGATAGLLASVRWLVNDIMNLTNKPKLVISHGPYAKNWQYLGTTQVRRFINFEVITKKGRTARGCGAKVTIIKHPDNVTHLEREYGLHWAGVPYSTLSTGAETVEIGAAPRRLDVAFTVPNQTGQSWIAMPIALTAPGQVPQASLPQGEYILRVTVYCENGRGDAKTIRLISPENWQDLQAEEVKRR
jgi:hypothetical protein